MHNRFPSTEMSRIKGLPENTESARGGWRNPDMMGNHVGP